jgi:xanthine dehydrogenase accessory factor
VDWPHRYLQQQAETGNLDSELSGLSSPVGLDLGGRPPEETAVSIAAEIIAARSGVSGARLA